MPVMENNSWKDFYSPTNFRCNTVCVDSDDGGGDDPVCIGPACVSLVKSCTNIEPVAEGDTIDYTFEIKACGDCDLFNIVIEDDKIETIVGGPLETLVAGETDSTTFTAQYTVTAEDIALGEPIVNMAVVSAEVVNEEGQTVTVEAMAEHYIDIKNEDTCEACVASVTIPDVTFVGAEGSDKSSLSVSVLESTLLGTYVRGYSGMAEPTISQSDFPLEIVAPPHQAGCVLALHIEYGADKETPSPQNSLQGPSLTQPTGTDISPHTKVCDQLFSETLAEEDGPSNGQLVYFFDGIGGNGGDSVWLDFAVNDLNDQDGAIFYHWVQICVDGEGTCTISDFDVGGAQSTITPDVTDTSPVNSIDTMDFGDCPAVVFAGARHAAFLSPPDYSEHLYNGDWFNLPGATELYDFVSWPADNICQLGSAAAYLPGGSGPVNYAFTNNQPTVLADSAACGVPINCAPGSVQCTDPEILTNANCNPSCDTTSSCSITASATMTIAPGESVSVVPVFDGIEQTAATVAQTNTTESEMVVTLPVMASLSDPLTTYGPGEDVDVQSKINVYTESSASSVALSAITFTCEMVPV